MEKQLFVWERTEQNVNKFIDLFVKYAQPYAQLTGARKMSECYSISNKQLTKCVDP